MQETIKMRESSTRLAHNHCLHMPPRVRPVMNRCANQNLQALDAEIHHYRILQATHP